MSKRVIDLAKLLKDNSHGPTDFTLQWEEYRWKVHSKLLIQKSDYFRNLCGHDSKSLNVNKAILDHGTLWSTARLLQYLYFKDYEYGSGSKMSAQQREQYLACDYVDTSSELLLSFDQLVPFRISDPDDAEEEDEDRDRPAVLIDIEMAQIATKYQVPPLIALASENLVSYLERKVRKRQYREKIAEMYPRIHQAMDQAFENDLWLTERMVEVLMAYKFETFKKAAPYTTFISPNEKLDRSPIILRFQEQIAWCISQGGIFAVTLVHALENALQKSLRVPEWPLEILQSDKVEGTYFGSRGAGFPVDGGQKPADWMD